MIKFRKLEPEDFDDLVELFTNEEVRRYLGGPIELSAAQDGAKRVIQKKPDYIHVITHEDNFIGTISFGEHVDTGKCEVSYQLLPRYWGYGHAQNALSMALNLVDDDVIVAETQVKNVRSRKLLERLGFKEIRELERFDEAQIYCELNR